MRIFLSYRRDDASGHAGRLYDLLAGRYGKQQVFMDLDAIPLGSRFGDEIDQAAAVGYFLFSDRATAAAWYRQTLESERVTARAPAPQMTSAAR